MRRVNLILPALLGCFGVSMGQADTSHYYDLDINSLFDVEVETASKKSESAFDSPTSISIITREEIQKSGITTLEEAFRLVQGMIVREVTNGNFDSHIRGLDNLPPSNFTFYSANSISLVMIDNRVVYNHMNGGTFWESLPISLTDIEKIEIVRGPNSALYGPNAAAGVINIITSRNNTNEKEFQLQSDLKFGSLNTRVANSTIKYKPSDRLFISASGNADMRERGQDTYFNYMEEEYRHKDSLIDYQGNSNYIGEVDKKWPEPELAKRKYGGNLFAKYQFGDETYIDASFGGQEATVQGVFMESTTTPILPRYSRSMNGQLKFNHKGLSTQLDYTQGQNNIQPGWGNISHFKYRKTNAIAEYEYKKNNLSIRPGVSYLHTFSTDLDFIPKDELGRGILNGNKELNNLAYFIKADYTAMDKVRFVVAVRNDHHLTLDKTAFSYQGAIMYKMAENHRLRAVTSKSNRAPFMADMYASYEAGGIVYQGNPDMELMEIHTHELGYRGKLGQFIELDMEAFISFSKNYSGLEYHSSDGGSGNIIFKYDNYDLEATQKGISGTVSYRPTEALSLSVFGTAQQTNLKAYKEAINPFNPFTGFDSIPDTTYTNTPSLYGGIKAQYNSEKWSIYTNGYFLGAHDYWYRIRSQNVGDKFRLDVTVSYKMLEKSSIYFTGRNILNSNKQEFGMADRIGAMYLLGVNLNI